MNEIQPKFLISFQIISIPKTTKIYIMLNKELQYQQINFTDIKLIFFK